MRRREFLGQAGALPAAPLLAASSQVGTRPAMKITDIKTFLVGAGGRNWRTT